MKYPIKNILLILVAILLVGGSFFYVEFRNKKTKEVYVSDNLKVINPSTDIAPAELDTDGDGSKDWEEILVGSDPSDPKSKPSTEKAKIATDLTKKPAEKLSNIDLISRDFFARYMELRQIGASSDPVSQKELVRNTAQNIILAKPVLYKIEDISTKPDSGNEEVKAYGDAVSIILKKNAIKSRNEAIIAQDYIKNENAKILAELDPIIASYKKMVSELLKLKVPQSIALLHLNLVNSINGAVFLAQSFRNSAANPVEGIQAVAYYEAVQNDIFGSARAIKSYFKYLGIYENIF